VTALPPVPEGPWFNDIARFLGQAYLRNAFTKGTEQEVEFLVARLGLRAGMRVLDAGCGPGRHALALARRGIEVVGVDLSPQFVELARAAADGLPAAFLVDDVRNLAYESEFDAVICLCQGGFGLLGGDEDEHDVVTAFARALVPGGVLALTAFSAYFVARHPEPGETFDASRGVHHERATVRGPEGTEQEFEMWTTCYTPRELRLLAARAGLVVDDVYGVAPGAYACAPPTVEAPEHLLVARRPGG
jgi:SAM-dependent methyltransferase